MALKLREMFDPGYPKTRNDGITEWRNGEKLLQTQKDGMAENYRNRKYPSAHPGASQCDLYQ